MLTQAPYIHALRYRWLRPVAEALVALPVADSDGPLAVAVAEALGRAAEHRLLLATLRAKAARDAGQELEDDDDEDSLDEDGNPPPAGDAGPHFNRRSPAYKPLPDARVAASGLDPRGFPALARLLASIGTVTAVAEAALERAGGASTQGLLEMYARLQQYRGVSSGLPAGAAAASAATSRVVSAIEALSSANRVNEEKQPAGAGAEKGGGDKGRKPHGSLAADAAAAIALLRALPGGPPLELWAKMARAVADAGGNGDSHLAKK